jgi:hypothetical protein
MSADLPATDAVPEPLQGHCVCGALRYTLTGAPLTFYACHCTDCQRRSTGALRLSMWVRRSDLRLDAGTPQVRSSILPSGRQRVALACADCDTELWTAPPDRPQLAILRPGTLVRGRDFTPVAHLYLRSALPWVGIPAGAARYDTAPADPGELVRLWRDRARPRD